VGDAVTSLYEQDGADRFVPTAAAAGPWNPGVLHGGAVAALLAGLLDDPEQVVVRVTVDLLGPVPSSPLRAEVGPTEGGRRVVRQSVTLLTDDRPVARASALRMRRGAVELPASATAHRVVFDPARVPDLSRPNQQAVKQVGWESFDSLAMAVRWEPFDPASGERSRFWCRLLLPVVAGRDAAPVERVLAAADFSGGTSRRLPFREWSFMNADLVVSLARPPEGDWVGLECEGLLGATGTGQSVSNIHDVAGPLGQASQAIILERKEPHGGPPRASAVSPAG